MVADDPRFSLRKLSVSIGMIAVLAACAAPSADDRTSYMETRYGAACSALDPEQASAKRQACLADAYNADRQRAIAQFNIDHGKTGVGALLLIH